MVSTARQRGKSAGFHQVAVFFACCLFFCSCGLDMFYVVESPANAEFPTDSQGFCRFTIPEALNDQKPDLDFYGTSVFYRIYADKNVMDREVSVINNSNSEYTTNGYNRLIGYGYTELLSAANQMPAIPHGTSDKRVEIRIADESVYLTAEITYTDSASTAVHSLGVPLRSNGQDFNFSLSYQPDSTVDEDYNSSGSVPAPTIWYVPLFAAVQASDGLTLMFSQLLYLGFFEIFAR